MRGPGPKWRAKHRPPRLIRPPHRSSGCPEAGWIRSEPEVGGAIAGAPPYDLQLDCDLIASILNPNRIFSATGCQETEITNKFVLVFNKFARTMAVAWGAPREVQRSESGTGKDISRPEGVMGKTVAQGDRACRPISPTSCRIWPGACSIRTGPSSTTCAGPGPSGTPSTTGRPSLSSDAGRWSRCG